MFVSQAHSFRQQSRLAITLAWVAGYTNIVTILACGTAISHATGTASNLGRDIGEGAWGLAAYAIFLLGTFVLGAVVSGICTEYSRHRGWESIYVLPMAMETGLLFLFALGIALFGPNLKDTGRTMYLIVGTASLAMGLQNATIARISNGDVRTTHVTGVLTDLGLAISQLVWIFSQRGASRQPCSGQPSRLHQCRQRLALLISITGSFALGAGLGTWGYEHAARGAMFAPVVFLAWIVYQDLVLPIAEIEPLRADVDGYDFQIPAWLALYRLARDPNGLVDCQRMPNLLAWADRLPAKTRVVILDVQQPDWLDENAFLEIGALLEHLLLQGRKLIIAGITAERYRLRNAAATITPLENICPDLEAAIARGLALAHEHDESALRTRAA